MGFELTPRERRWFEALLVLATIAVGFVVLSFVGGIVAYFGDLIMLFFLAWLLAFMLGPLVTWATKVPFMTRTGAIFTVYLVIFGGLVLVTIVVAAALVTSLSDFIEDLPSLRANLPDIVRPWQERLNDLGFSNVDLLAQVTAFLDNINQYAQQLVEPLQQLAVASLGAIANLLLVVVLSLYMVADRDRIQAFFFGLVPRAYRTEVEILEEAVSRSFGGFIRGNVVTGLAFGAICFLVSVVFGLDFLPVTTATAGVLMMIPFFGPFVAWVPPVLVTILTKPDTTLFVAILVGIGWLVVMNALQPRIMASSLRIHPLVVLGSVLVGLKVAGIPGAIFGIPIAAVISALILYQLRRLGNGPVAMRAAARVGRREGRAIRAPREPDPTTDRDVEGDAAAPAGAPMKAEAAEGVAAPGAEAATPKTAEGSASNPASSHG
ncbi:MAG TPA: AI-2E family transporter [Candidatus Binatia bacterium]|nr:AI-2E family transporter [Candidatus Binatia bacterium]